MAHPVGASGYLPLYGWRSPLDYHLELMEIAARLKKLDFIPWLVFNALQGLWWLVYNFTYTRALEAWLMYTKSHWKNGYFSERVR